MNVELFRVDAGANSVAVLGYEARRARDVTLVVGHGYSSSKQNLDMLCAFLASHGFSIYSLAALLPLLPAKQRPTHPNDWMTTDAEVACPDPNCSSRFLITRMGLRRFSHAATTAVPLGGKA